MVTIREVVVGALRGRGFFCLGLRLGGMAAGDKDLCYLVLPWPGFSHCTSVLRTLSPHMDTRSKQKCQMILRKLEMDMARLRPGRPVRH